MGFTSIKSRSEFNILYTLDVSNELYMTHEISYSKHSEYHQVIVGYHMLSIRLFDKQNVLC